MARVAHSGFELLTVGASGSADTVDGVRWTGSTNLTIDALVPHGGAACLKYVSTTNAARYVQTPITRVSGRVYYARVWVRLPASPAAAFTPLTAIDTGSILAAVQISTGRVPTIISGTGSGAALAVDTWYCLELSVTSNGTVATAELRVDGTVVSTRTAFATALIVNEFRFGNNTGSNPGTVYFDDLAVNDDQGSSQNSWPGVDGKLILLTPVSDYAIGTDWTKGQTGAISGDAYDSVNNVPPTGRADNVAGADASQLRDAVNSLTPPAADLEFTLQAPTTQGAPSDAVIKLINAYAIGSDSTGVAARNLGTRLTSPADSGEVTFGITGAAATYPGNANWVFQSGNIVYSPAMVATDQPRALVGRRNTGGNVNVVTFVGAYVEYEPPGDQTISDVGGIASAEAFGTPRLNLSIAATGIASEEAFGALTLTYDQFVDLAGQGIPSAEAVGTPSLFFVGTVIDLDSQGIPSAEAFGTPRLRLSISMAGIASQEAFGAVKLNQKVDLSGGGIPSAEAFGTPTVTYNLKISPVGIPSAEAFGTPRVVTEQAMVAEILISPTGVEASISAELPPVVGDPGTVSYDISTGSADGGTFVLTLDGTPTAPISPLATLAEVQAALDAVTALAVSVTGTAGSWTVTIADAGATLTINTSNLTQTDSAIPPTPDLPGSLSSTATFAQRWASGLHVGNYSPKLRAAVRRGRFNRAFRSWSGLSVDATVYGNDPDTPWQATWTPYEAYVDIPGVLSIEESQNFDQEGLTTVTLQVENIGYQQEAGGQHSFHRGHLSPLRGYVAAGRTTLTDEHGAAVGQNSWFDKLRQNAQITVWQGYGTDLMPKTFTGLVDDVDATSNPDVMTITMRCFGGVLADERVFGWNKDKNIRDPVIFIDKEDAQEVVNVGGSPLASSEFNSAHSAEMVDDTDIDTDWWSFRHSANNFTVWVQIEVPEGYYEEIRLRLPVDNQEVYVSVKPELLSDGDDPRLDGVNIEGGSWYNPNTFDDLVPGENGGIGYVFHDTDVDSGAHNISLGGRYYLGPNSKIRVSLRNLQFILVDGIGGFVGQVSTLQARRDGGLVDEARTQRWVRVGDVADVVKVVLRWAGFKEWEIESTGVKLAKRLVVNRGMTYMDVIKICKDAVGYDFFVKGPTAADLSIGRPVFRQSRIVTNDAPVATVTDQLLLGEIQMRMTDESRATVIRVRGRESKSGRTLGSDRTKRVMYTYWPPWSAQPFTAKWRQNGGVTRHVIHTDHLLKSVGGCKMACYSIALREAIASYLAVCQLPANPGINLDDHVELLDLGTGISTRVNVRERRMTATLGENAAWVMTISGALVDVPDVQEIVTLINNAVID